MKDFNIFAALLQLLQTLCNVINRRFVMDKKELVQSYLPLRRHQEKPMMKSLRLLTSAIFTWPNCFAPKLN